MHYLALILLIFLIYAIIPLSQQSASFCASPAIIRLFFCADPFSGRTGSSSTSPARHGLHTQYVAV
ncbi:hypothetical protein EI827_19695 [Salmonella enterica subsp. enterica serovar Oranienburg]|nr:hypothetical protein [Salmonella enterica subsp. enterica serovar Oranienburg]ECA1474315.1 hypothetical protein [Salmonella enterica subsp. enterica serovar Oranienburg]ECA9000400.1 hypothetical protein [Salmonella enterica subsp. enterica serovar Oranienburg]ECA9347257.1 hypothetical protein [Salmonella enterica subsp. enterica serovar Oranienburg]ECD3079468.1 hypothetical protein [Salmonella enterica subsp. enterica serovar Oranienburg]